MIITAANLADIREKHKAQKIGICWGVFDLFHIGHLNFIKFAKSQCDILIVAVRDDATIQIFKNKTPIINQSDRIQIIDALKYVDYTILGKPNPANQNLGDVEITINYFKALQPDVFVLSEEHTLSKQFLQFLTDLKIKIVYSKYTNKISSTIIKDKIKKKA